MFGGDRILCLPPWRALFWEKVMTFRKVSIGRALGIRVAGAALATIGVACLGIGTLTPFSGAKLVANNGDVWVDTVANDDTQISGHEQDPHLPCANINLWGNGLADSTGHFTIFSKDPSDQDFNPVTDIDQDWPTTGAGTWTYNQSAGGNQKIAPVIVVATLIKNAVANGDVAQPEQGFHFKIDFDQDPNLSKTFWVACNATANGPPPSNPPTCTTCVGGGPSSGVAGASTAVTPSTPSTGTGGAIGTGLALLAMGAALVAGGIRLSPRSVRRRK